MMNPIRLFAFSLLTSLAFSSVAAAQPTPRGKSPRYRAIVDTRIVVRPGKVIERGNIIIRDGLIVAVGRGAKVPLAADVIDGKGLTAYAGFIDAGNTGFIDAGKVPKPSVGRKVDFARGALAATRTDNRRGLSPDFRVATALKLDAKQLDAVRQAGFTVLHVLPTGRIAGGQGTLIAAGGLPVRESILREATFAQFRLFALRGSTYPSTLMGATAHLRQAFLDAGRYQRHKDLFNKHNAPVARPPIDRTLEALGVVQRGEQPAVFDAKSADDIRRALAFAKEQGIKPIVWGARDSNACLAALKRGSGGVIHRLDFGGKPGIRVPKNGKQLDPKRPAPLRVQRDELRRWQHRVSNLAALQRAKVPVAISSHGRKNLGEVLQHVRLAIDHGLPRDAALAALTSDAAKLLGMDRRLGTLEVGKLAHIVLMTGEFDDSRTEVKTVVIETGKFEYNAKAKPLKANKRKVIAAGKPAKQDWRRTGQLPSELKSDRLRRPFRTNGDVLIKNATVLTGTGKTLKNTSILILKGKFKAIGRNLKAPRGVRVIDATGRYVMPGIIDTHSHIMITSGVNEATQSITPEVRIRDVVNTDSDSEYRALAGGVTTARLFHGSANVIGGQDAVVKLKYGKTAAEHFVPNAPQGVKFALGENVKYQKTRFPNTRLGVEATLKRAFLEAIEYRRRWTEYNNKVKALKGKQNLLLPPRRDLRLEALADIVNHKKFIHSHCYRADEILMLLRVASNLGIRVWSLQHVLEGYKIAPEIVRHGASCSTFADWWAYKVEAYDATPYNAALLREAGANVVIKSDSAELIRHLPRGAAKTIRYGNMHPDHALQTITLNPARELGLDKRIGSIEVGKDGDVAIYSSHPLNAFSRCEMTLIEGEVYFSRKHSPTAMSNAAVARSTKPKPFAFPSTKVRNRKLDLKIAENGRYAITNVTLHRVDGPDIKKGTIVIQGGKIVALGRNAKLPKGVKVIDGRGLHVAPGFIDAGTTLGLTEIARVKETQDYSESGGIQPDLRAGVALNRDSELVPVARAGGITTVLVRPTGGIITGQASIARLAGWTSPEMVIELEAGLQINWPNSANRKKLDVFLKQARQYDKLRSEAKRKKVRGPIVDPQLEAMRPYLHREKPIFIEADKRQEIVEALQFAEKEKLKIIITGGTDAWKVAGELKKRKIPVIIGPVMQRPMEKHDPFDAPYANAGRLHEAGVKFCIRSRRASNSRNAPLEAAMAVAYGLPEKEGLRAVTLSAAEILNVADKLGSLTPGKQANLVITDGPPLQHTSQIKGIFIDGKPFAPNSRQTRFYEQYRKRLHEYRDGRNGK